MLAFRQHRHAVATHSRCLGFAQHKPSGQKGRLPRQHGSTSSTLPVSVCRATLAAPHGNSNGRKAPKHEHNTDPVQSFQDLFQQDTPMAELRRQQQANADVHMCMVHAVDYGKKLRVVGSPPALGAWDAQQGPDLSWHEGHKWTVDVGLAVGSYEFKYVLVHDSGHIEWEEGSNRVLEVPPSAAEMQVKGQWGQTQDTEVLEVREKPSWTQWRQQEHQQLLLLQEAAGIGVDAGTANAAAEAADMLQSMLLKQQTQRQQQQQDDESLLEAAGAGLGTDTTMAADLLQSLLQQQKELLKQQLKQQKEAQQAAAGIDSSQERSKLRSDPAAGIVLAASDSSSSSVMPPAFSSAQDKLMLMLHEMKDELTSSIAGVAAAVEDVQDEVSNVQQQVAQLTAERILQQQQQQQQGQQQQGQGQGADAGVLGAGMADLAHSSSSSSSSGSSSGLPAGWGTAAAAAAAAVEAAPAFVPSSDLSPSSAASLSGLHTAVLSWRQEVLTFRQESMLMRTEIHGLKDGMDDIEHQLQANTTAIKELQEVVMEQEAYDRARAARFSSSGSSRAAAGGGEGRSASEQHRGAADGDLEDLLVSKFNQLAADLTAEVKHAVQEVAAVQQQQAVPLDDLVRQVWMRPPENLLDQILHHHQQQA